MDITKTGALKTHIVYGANMNFDNVKPYLKTLRRRGLLTLDENEGRYFTTEKGFNYLHVIANLDIFG